MSNMHVTIPHSLPQAEAVRRIQGLLQDVRRQYGDKVTDINEQWAGSRGTFDFKAMGMDISGTLEVDPQEVRINGTLPMAASFFKGVIEQTIRDHASRLLA